MPTRILFLVTFVFAFLCLCLSRSLPYLSFFFFGVPPTLPSFHERAERANQGLQARVSELEARCFLSDAKLQVRPTLHLQHEAQTQPHTSLTTNFSSSSAPFFSCLPTNLFPLSLILSLPPSLPLSLLSFPPSLSLCLCACVGEEYSPCLYVWSWVRTAGGLDAYATGGEVGSSDA